MLFRSDIEVVKSGGDPKGTYRDPKANECIMLPVPGRKNLIEGLSREQFDKVEGRNANSTLGGTGMRRFNWLVGQPEEIEREYNEVMGWKVPTPQA